MVTAKREYELMLAGISPFRRHRHASNAGVALPLNQLRSYSTLAKYQENFNSTNDALLHYNLLATLPLIFRYRRLHNILGSTMAIP